MDITTSALAHRAEASEAAHWSSLVEGLAELPGNPYGAEVKRFGKAVALRCPGMKSRSFVNRVLFAGPVADEDLVRAVAFVRADGIQCRVDVPPFQADEPFLARLAQQGFRQMGFQVALCGAPRTEPLGLPSGVEIRPAETEEQVEFAAAALPVVFGSTRHWVLWLGDSLRVTARRPGWRTYIAYVDGELAGFAQLHIADGVGSLALAGTLEAYRGRGAQTALIRRRIADAVAAGCDLICTQTGFATVSQQNMERLGLRIAYTKGEFYDQV